MSTITRTRQKTKTARWNAAGARRSVARCLPYGCVLLGAALWGCIGLFNRNLTALGFSAASIVVVRNVGTAALLALFFLLTDRSAFRIHLRHLPCFLGTGIVSVLCFTLCYFRSQQLNSLAVAAILLYTSPAFVVLLSALLFRERITGKKLLALLLAFLGCVLASGILEGGGLSLTPTGLLLGLGSGLLYAFYTIFARVALAHYRSLVVTLYTFIFASLGSLVLLLFGWAEFPTAAFSAESALLALGLVVLSTVLPYLLYAFGLQGLGDSGKTSILASIEPVIAAIVGALAFGEPFSPGALGGLACILASVFVLR
ncbi:MAG: DMT family transporter [Oscillospiraceae bacterium]|nr:DMT family transporter [Oscillospiraceae bacterium]